MTSNIIHDIMILYILQQHTGTCVGPILAGQKNFWTESLGETQEQHPVTSILKSVSLSLALSHLWNMEFTDCFMSNISHLGCI